jgi:hypothetical protein
MTQRLLSVFAALILLSLASPAHADFINGNFQTGDLTGWTVFTTPHGTNGTLDFEPLPNVVSFNTTGSGASLAAQFNVGQANGNGTGQQGGGIFQDVNLTAGTHTLTGVFASTNDQGAGLNVDAGTFSVLVDGVTEQSDSLGGFSSVPQTLRGSFDVTFTTTAGVHAIDFQITRGYETENGATPLEYLDNLSVTGTASVPEPASLMLFACGAVGLISYNWRRRK